MSYWNGWDVNDDLRAIGGWISGVIGVLITGIILYFVLTIGVSVLDSTAVTILTLVWSLFVMAAVQPIGFRQFGRFIKEMYLSWAIRKPSGFNLQVGMTNKEIYKELHMKTAGETEQEVQYLLSTDHNSSAKRRIDRAANIFGGSVIGPALEVIEANDKYAVIRKTRIDGSLRKNEIYYLTGINDEGYYFVHAIEEPRLSIDKSGTLPKGYDGRMSLDQLVDHINRIDEGYQRLQGDVLYKLVPIERKFGHIKAGEFTIDRAPELDKPNLTPIELGNHQVFYTGGYWSGMDQTLIIGTKAIMKHPQHSDVTVNIPAGHGLILTHQRSRNIQLPNSFGRSNYD